MTGAPRVNATEGAGPDTGRWAPAAGLARWLAFAASPTFAAMALQTLASSAGSMDAICAAGRLSPLSGMAPMYLLMSAFHSGPWLGLIPRRARRGDRRHFASRRGGSSADESEPPLRSYP